MRHFPGAELTHSWSAQDYHSDHELPFVGPLTPRDDQVLLATGFDKWGMTMAVASAVALSSRILGGHTEWAAALETWTTRELSGAVAAAKANLEVGGELAGGWARSMLTSAGDEPPIEGQGRVERHGSGPVAVCTVGGVTIQRSAVCTHLGRNRRVERRGAVVGLPAARLSVRGRRLGTGRPDHQGPSGPGRMSP